MAGIKGETCCGRVVCRGVNTDVPTVTICNLMARGSTNIKRRSDTLQNTVIF